MKLNEALTSILPPHEPSIKLAKKHFDNIIKPLNSLGMLESHLIKIAGITRSEKMDLSRKAVVVFCADNGVVVRGVTQSGQEVTTIVAENMAVGDTCLCSMAKVANADVIPVDIGIASDIPKEVTGLIRKKIAHGTADFTARSAMTIQQAIDAIEVGIELAFSLKQQGYQMLATGEMGIGNTVTTAAMTSLLLNVPPKATCGRGSGLSDQGFARKIQIVSEGVDRHRSSAKDSIAILAAVGGFDIAGMIGLCIGGAAAGIPVVLDGSISCIAAYTAYKLNPLIREYILPSHLSPEPSAALLLEHLSLTPPLQAQMRLGEGSGAVATFPLYDMALAVYNNMITFEEEQMEAYLPL